MIEICMTVINLDHVAEINLNLNLNLNILIHETWNCFQFCTCWQISAPMEQRRESEKLYNKGTLAQLQNISTFVSSIIELLTYWATHRAADPTRPEPTRPDPTQGSIRSVDNSDGASPE